MRLVFPVVIAAAASLAACGGSSKSATPTPPASASTPRAATSIPPPATPARAGTAGAATRAPSDSETVELTGVVGSITPATRTFTVTRLSGATVNQIEVQDSTRIRKAEGGTETFAQIRTSDRVIASGHLNDRGDALVADDITVQSGIAGAQPGG